MQSDMVGGFDWAAVGRNDEGKPVFRVLDNGSGLCPGRWVLWKAADDGVIPKEAVVDYHAVEINEQCQSVVRRAWNRETEKVSLHNDIHKFGIDPSNDTIDWDMNWNFHLMCFTMNCTCYGTQGLQSGTTHIEKRLQALLDPDNWVENNFEQSSLQEMQSALRVRNCVVWVNPSARSFWENTEGMGGERYVYSTIGKLFGYRFTGHAQSADHSGHMRGRKLLSSHLIPPPYPHLSRHTMWQDHLHGAVAPEMLANCITATSASGSNYLGGTPPEVGATGAAMTTQRGWLQRAKQHNLVYGRDTFNVRAMRLPEVESMFGHFNGMINEVALGEMGVTHSQLLAMLGRGLDARCMAHVMRCWFGLGAYNSEHLHQLIEADSKRVASNPLAGERFTKGKSGGQGRGGSGVHGKQPALHSDPSKVGGPHDMRMMNDLLDHYFREQGGGRSSPQPPGPTTSPPHHQPPTRVGGGGG